MATVARPVPASHHQQPAPGQLPCRRRGSRPASVTLRKARGAEPPGWLHHSVIGNFNWNTLCIHSRTMNAPIAKLPIPTSDGIFLAHYSTNGLAELNFPDRHEPDSKTQAKNGLTAEISEWHQTAVTALK